MENQLLVPHLNNTGSSNLLSAEKLFPSSNDKMPTKTFGDNVFKPKGLTMRSMSHYNLNDTLNPYKKIVPKHSPNKLNLRPLSPYRRLLLQKQTVRFGKKKELFLAKLSEAQKLAAQHQFLKPNQSQFKYPEPECLAHELDDSLYDDIMHLDSPFKNLTVQDEDEGFISDPELLPISDDLSFIFSDEDETEDYVNEVKVKMDYDIPELSDLEDR